MPENPESLSRSLKLEDTSPSDPLAGRSWILGIGINQYAEFPTLNNAVKDVQDLIELLLTEYDFDPAHVRTLYDGAATRENIIETLDQLQREVSTPDKVLIYYSGHGHLNRETGKGYWIPTNAERDNTAEYIRNSTIRDYLEDLRSRHTLLISDSCFSGTLFVRGTNRSAEVVRELEKIPSRWAICSGRHDEEVYDGRPGTNSPFAESILDTLRYNDQTELHVAKLIDRVIEQTRSNYEQLPEGNPVYGVGHKGGQFIFRRRRALAIASPTGDQTGAGKKLPPEEKKPKTPAPTLSNKNTRKLQSAFRALVKRTNSDAFVIIEEAESEKFVQFSGNGEQGLTFNLPTILLDAGEISRAIETLQEYGMALRPSQLYTDESMTEKGDTLIEFNEDIGPDIDLAVELVARVMMQVYQFPADVALVLREN